MAWVDELRELYDVSYPRLVVQLFALCGDLGEAEDAVQEAFVAAVGRGRSLAQVDNQEAWLRTVARNHLRNRWRHLAVADRMRHRVPRPGDAAEVGPDHVALVDALHTLDAPHRTVTVLHYLADRSVGEIAAELGIPAGTVKSRLSRSRELLAPLLNDTEEVRHG